MTTIRDLLSSGAITPETVVLGWLPMSGDGCIMGDFAEVYFMLRKKGIVRHGVSSGGIRIVLGQSERFRTMGTKPELCYSTRAAAEAAREARERSES